MRKEYKIKPNATSHDLAKLVFETNEHHIMEAYHRSVEYGHRIPGVGIRVRGHLTDAHSQLTIKALDFATLPKLLAAKCEPMQEVCAKALLDGAPPGHFPCIIAEESPAPLYPWQWFKIPD
jgi:hypothetical protein